MRLYEVDRSNEIKHIYRHCARSDSYIKYTIIYYCTHFYMTIYKNDSMFYFVLNRSHNHMTVSFVYNVKTSCQLQKCTYSFPL